MKRTFIRIGAGLAKVAVLGGACANDEREGGSTAPGGDRNTRSGESRRPAALAGIVTHFPEKFPG